MKIITVPHLTLRSSAEKVLVVTPAVQNFIQELTRTLDKQRRPQGVGLAANQVDKTWQVFATRVNTVSQEDTPASSPITIFINPQITSHSQQLILGPTPSQPRLEGCLSIPKLYGPVPRWSWVELEYQVVDKNTQELKTKTGRFTDFYARVIQHEYDHLHGVLFTDYSLQLDLPVYQENPKTGELEELENREVLEIF